jgi:hypothetical protein
MLKYACLLLTFALVTVTATTASAASRRTAQVSTTFRAAPLQAYGQQQGIGGQQVYGRAVQWDAGCTSCNLGSY